MATDYLINKPPETKAKNEKKTQEAKEKTREMLKKEARRIKKAYKVAKMVNEKYGVPMNFTIGHWRSKERTVVNEKASNWSRH